MKIKKSEKTVCIFCSSSSDVSDTIKTSASLFATLLAKGDFNLLYGGTNCGLMGIIANAHKSANGYTIGVIPQYMVKQRLVNNDLDEIIQVEDLRPRKQKMLELSDYIVALPGGIGTYDEFFDLLTLKQLNRHQKAMFLLNTDNYFKPFLALIKHGIEQNTIKANTYELFKVAQTPEELINLITNVTHLSK